MAKIFEIALLNPIRFISEDSAYNPSVYWTRHFDSAFSSDLIKPYQTQVYYAQKYTKIDRPVIQILSDYPEITASLYNCETHVKEYDLSVNSVMAGIEDETFSIYEVPVDFLNEGDFYIKITYKNDLDEDVNYLSEPINIKTIQEGTIKYEYKNSQNDFSIIFETDWTGVLRVESDIIDFKPGSEDTVYVDEIHDTTLVNSTPFRTFTLAIGGKIGGAYGGVPDYIVDKINRIFSCDQLLLDGKYFCKSDGAQFEEFRSENYPFTAQKISISETENKFQYQFDTSIFTEEMIPIYKVIPYKNNTSDITINNIFKRFTCLEKICIVNRGAPFTINIKTSTTGSEDDFEEERIVSNTTTTILLNQTFDLDKQILISGLNFSTLDLFVVYQKLDATIIGTSNPYGAIGIGGVVIYEENSPGDFILDFNVLTGLGQSEAWDKWAICDGRNGTTNRVDRFPIGCSGIDPLYPAGETGGSFLKRILRTHLPKINFHLFSDPLSEGVAPIPTPFEVPAAFDVVHINGRGYSPDDQYRMQKSPIGPAKRGVTNTIGGTNGDGTGDETENFNITPPYVRSIWVKKIAE